MNVLKKVFHLLLITCAAAMAQGKYFLAERLEK